MEDLIFKNFFVDEVGVVGKGYIELVDEIFGNEILRGVFFSGKDLVYGILEDDIW